MNILQLFTKIEDKNNYCLGHKSKSFKTYCQVDTFTFQDNNTLRMGCVLSLHLLHVSGFYVTTFMNYWLDIKQGQVARLQSPTIPSAKCVVFYYFMGGSTVGELIVYVKTATKEEKLVWQLIGDQGFEWKKGVIPVDSKYKNFSVSIPFTALTIAVCTV